MFCGYGGNNPWSTFNVPSNAKDLSLAEANVSEGSIGFYQFANPALLTKTNNLDFGLCYNMMALDRSTQVVSVNFNLPPKAGIGLSAMRSGTSKIQGKDSFNNNTYEIDVYDMLGMISFGVSIHKYASIGINIKASYSNLDNIFENIDAPSYSLFSKGIGVDFGGAINLSNFFMGLKIENIKTSNNWNLNLGDEGNSYEQNVPVIYKIGTHYKASKTLMMYLENDIIHNSSYLLKYSISYNINNYGFQCGFSHDFKKKSKFMLPVFGFYYSGHLWGKQLFDLNYGINLGNVDEGISHIFTWTIIK